MAAVRDAVLSDIDKVAALEKELFSDAWSENMLTDCMQQSHYRVSVCVNELQEIVGYLISTHVAGEAELLRIGVRTEMRQRGLGSMLMAKLVQLCAKLQTPDVFLEVRESNESAISLYKRFGFETVGKRKNYYHHPEEDARLMHGNLQ